jgi:dTDP-4-amino-4,6-dideoxygalactose transaminase
MLLDDSFAKVRPEIMAKLAENGVGTSIYYPRPVPHMEYYSSKYGYGVDLFPNASAISNSIIALPVGPHLSEDDMDYVAASIKQIWTEINV